MKNEYGDKYKEINSVPKGRYLGDAFFRLGESMNEIVFTLSITKLHLLILLVGIINLVLFIAENNRLYEKEWTVTITYREPEKETNINQPINPIWWAK